MCSYNRINGTYACENSQVQNYLLKNELSFQGFGIAPPSPPRPTASTSSTPDFE